MGDAFYEHDFLTGLEQQIPLDQFPTYDELCARYASEANTGTGLTPAQKAIIKQPYYTSATTYAPRYYQRIAINRSVDAIAKGQNRLLLVMATGARVIIQTGHEKPVNLTFTAFLKPVFFHTFHENM